MRRVTPLVLLLLAFALLSVSEAPAQDRRADDATAFVDVNVLPMTAGGEPVLEDRTVVVRGGEIATVGPASEVTVPDPARRIDGDGRYLLPGLAEMHGHVPSPEDQPQYTKNVLMLYLANGVTTVRGMLGQSGQLQLRERANSGEIRSPTLYLAGPPFTGGSVESPDDARQMVRRQHNAGWDFLKVLEGMTRAEYDAMAEVAQEVGIPFVGHVPNDVGLMRTLEAEQQTIDHLDGYVPFVRGSDASLSEERLRRAVRKTRETNTWMVPTMAVWETLQGAVPLDTLTDYPELKYLPPDQVRQWTASHRKRRRASDFDEAETQRLIQNRTRILRALHEGKAPIVFGTDSPQQFSVPGFSIHREVKRLKRAGLTPYEILVTATRNVGQYLQDKDDFGTVEEGARADLILLEENPLEDLSRLTARAGVMTRGRWLSDDAIQQRLQKIAASYQ